MNDFERIYRDWHEYAKNRDTEALIGLYADDAVLESPLVPVILKIEGGILNGKAESCVFYRKARGGGRMNWYAGIATAAVLFQGIR